MMTPGLSISLRTIHRERVLYVINLHGNFCFPVDGKSLIIDLQPVRYLHKILITIVIYEKYFTPCYECVVK